MIPGFFAVGAMGGSAPVSPTSFFNSDPMLSTGWGQVTYPAAIYVASTNKTIVCWQFVGLSGYKGVHVAEYNHTTGAWSERYTVGNFLLPDDDHGDAVLVRDASGYIHCFYGSHVNGQKYSVTNAPDDISAWTQRPDLGSSLTYPKPVLVGSKIHLFAREAAISTNRKMALFTTTPAAGIATWAALSDVVDFGADSRVYTAEAHAVGTNIHLVCTRSDSADTIRRGVYYFVYNTVTGGVTNFDGSFTVASGSLPVTLTQSNTNFRVYDHGSNDGDLGSFQFDTSGNAHIIFADGLTPTYDLKHIMLSGGSWSSPVTIDSIPDGYPAFGFVSNYTLVRGASDTMEAWYNNSAGDKIRKIRSAAGTWGSAQTILTAGSLDLLQGTAVKDADPSLRTFFAENSGTTTDSGAVALDLYSYGDSGSVSGSIDMTPVDTAGFSNVVLLLGARHRNGATSIIDESKSSLRLAFTGNAVIDTAQTPFAGGASLKLDGTGDYLTAITHADLSLSGSGDLCVDGWIRRNDTGRFQCIMSNRPAPGTTPNMFGIYLSATNRLQVINWNGATVVANLTGTTTISTGAWTWFEVSRIGGTFYLFVNGNLEVSGAQSAAPGAPSNPLVIGRDPNDAARDFNGWMADLRFTRAGRHSASYTPPTTWVPRR